ARLDRMEVHVLHAFGRLTGQPGRVVVRDVLVVGIEEVQHVEPQIETAALEADRGIHDGRRTRPRAAVLDQGAWTEITYPGAAVPSARSLKRDARRHYAIDRAWDLVSGRIILRELGLGQRELDIERHVVIQAVVDRELEPIAPACAARLRVARVPDEQELGVELEVPQSRRHVELPRSECAKPELELTRFDERIHALGCLARDGIDGDGRTASVVAMKALTGARIDLDLVT